MSPFGGHRSEGVAAHVIRGGVLSILTVTSRDDDLPAAFTALQVSVRPAGMTRSGNVAAQRHLSREEGEHAGSPGRSYSVLQKVVQAPL